MEPENILELFVLGSEELALVGFCDKSGTVANVERDVLSAHDKEAQYGVMEPGNESLDASLHEVGLPEHFLAYAQI